MKTDTVSGLILHILDIIFAVSLIQLFVVQKRPNDARAEHRKSRRNKRQTWTPNNYGNYFRFEKNEKSINLYESFVELGKKDQNVLNSSHFLIY